MAQGTGGEASVELIERFAQFARGCLEETCVVVVVQPWSTGVAPPGILAPPAQGDVSRLPEEELTEVFARYDTALVPCTFEASAEVSAGKKIVGQLTQCQSLCTLMVQLLPESTPPSRETNQLIMRRGNAMFACGAADVLLDPEFDQDEMILAIKTARCFWHIDKRRMDRRLSMEPERVSADSVRELQKHHRSLLWEGLPTAIMPKMKPLQRSLQETGTSVGSYTYVTRFKTIHGVVLKAQDAERNLRVIKIIEKSEAYLPEEVEDIYREYVFLSQLIHHPNVVRCLDMLHSVSRIYFVLEFAGEQNLAQVLQSAFAQRFQEDESMQVFDQVHSGLAFCHSKNVAHRNVCLEHIAVSAQHRYKILDFRSAIVLKGQNHSRTICGRLPAIAPQVALGRTYMPRLADSWNLGVVLLEMAGGMGALSRSIPYDPGSAEAHLEAPKIHSFFQSPGSHSVALSVNGGIPGSHVLSMLQVLLVPEEANRMELQQLFRMRHPELCEEETAPEGAGPAD